MKRISALLVLGLAIAPCAWAALPASGAWVPYRSGEVLVKYRDNTNAAAASALRNSHGMQSKLSLLDNRAELLSLPSVMDVPAAVAMLSRDPAVEYAEPNFLRRKLSVTPNDPLFAQQWGLSNTGQANFVNGGLPGTPGGDLNLVNAWDLDNNGVADHTGRGTITIAVVDDAVETTHPDLAANIVAGFNFVDNNTDPNPRPTATDPQSHGTSVAGSAAAVGNNGIGVSGAAWNEKIMPLKFGFDVATEVRALQFARDNGARVVNASFGGPSYTRTEFDAISALNDAGILFVVAAGNENANNDFAGAAYPANYQLPNVVAVAATNRQDDIASFSSYGSTTVPVAAPGLQIVTTAVNGGYTTNPGVSGTSFSSPYVAGVAALLFDYIPAATAREVKARLIEGANAGLDPLAPVALRSAGGRVDTANSLRLAPRPSLVIHPVQTSSYQVDYGSPEGVVTIPVFSPVSISDGGNNTLDPGESANVVITLENIWQSATNVRGTLSAVGAGVTVNSGAVAFGNIAAQTTAAATFNVSVPASVTGHQYVYFTLDITADGGYTASRHFIQEIGRLQNGVAAAQAIQTDLYDEFHTWHFDVGTLPAGSNTLSFTATATNDIDIIVSYGAPAQYSIELGADPNATPKPLYFYNVPAAQVSNATRSGAETVTIAAPQSGTYYVTVVNFDQQQNAGYTLLASLTNTPPPPPPPPSPAPQPSSGGGAMPPLVLLGLLVAVLRRRRDRRSALIGMRVETCRVGWRPAPSSSEALRDAGLSTNVRAGLPPLPKA